MIDQCRTRFIFRLLSSAACGHGLLVRRRAGNVPPPNDRNSRTGRMISPEADACHSGVTLATYPSPVPILWETQKMGSAILRSRITRRIFLKSIVAGAAVSGGGIAEILAQGAAPGVVTRDS